MAVFDKTRFLLIDGDQKISDETESLLVSGGGTVFRRSPIQSVDAIRHLAIDHIVTETYDFPAYADAVELFIPITTSAWVSDTCREKQQKNYRLYAPQPAPFMDKVVVCIADNLAQGDKEMMYAGVRAFGGQFLDCLSRYTTHLVAVDLTNNKSVVACNIKKTEGLEIKVVLPQWLDHCIAHQQHVDETPFLLSDPVVLQTGKPNFSAPLSFRPLTNDVLLRKRVYLCSDHHLSEHVESAIVSLVESCGGTMETEFDPSKIDIFLGKWREGPQFEACVAHPDVTVASLHWFYYVVRMKQFVDPLESNLLHCPIPKTPVPGFSNLRFSVTGANGDARHYLMMLILAMGATFTKTLDSNNDFLVTHSTHNEKYIRAKTDWTNIKTVNTLWLEECFLKWTFLDPTESRFDPEIESSRAVGSVRLGQGGLAAWAKSKELPTVGDSQIEDHPVFERELAVEADVAEASKAEEVNGQAGLSQNGDEHEISSGQRIDIDKEVDNLETDYGQSQDSEHFYEAMDQESTTRSQSSVAATPVEVVKEISVVDSESPEDVPSQPGNGRSARSAKQKASMKLHSDMDDLNQYTSMSKSARKMKTYMEQLENSISTPAKGKASKRSATPEEGPKQPQSPALKKKKVEKEAHVVAVMTGCEQELTLNRADLVKLAQVGIAILNDYNSKKKIDTIVAPRVLRTEKFLKSLSKATRIVHPSYLSDVLSRLSNTELSWADLSREFKIDDYALDKVVSVKQINEDLGFAGKANGLQQLLASKKLVFEGVQLNLSTNLNGGADLIASILKEHGLESSKTLKLSATIKKSALLQSDDKCIVVAHKTKDKKAISALKEVTVVDWDWCVKSIFHGQLQDYSSYLI